MGPLNSVSQTTAYLCPSDRTTSVPFRLGQLLILRTGAVLGAGMSVPGLEMVDVGGGFDMVSVLPGIDIADTVTVLAGCVTKDVKF